MSRLIRNTDSGRKILIGDRRFDAEAQASAEQKLGELFPVVTITTQADGSKGIPINEVFKIDAEHQARLKQVREEEFKRGFKAGREEGLQEGLAQAREVTAQFQQAITDAVGQREALLEEARQNVLDIIIKTARKVTFDAVKVDQDLIVEMVARVIDRLVDKTHIKINVNPDHLPIVEQNLDRFLKGSSSIKQISFKADPRVRYGGCFIETPSGDVDARLSSQFEVIEQVIREGDERS